MNVMITPDVKEEALRLLRSTGTAHNIQSIDSFQVVGRCRWCERKLVRIGYTLRGSGKIAPEFTNRAGLLPLIVGNPPVEMVLCTSCKGEVRTSGFCKSQLPKTATERFYERYRRNPQRVLPDLRVSIVFSAAHGQ